MGTELVIGAAVALVVSALACMLVIAAGIWDAPNDSRKVHTTPTPTSGGLGVAIGVCVGVALLAALPAPEWVEPIGPRRLGRMMWALAAALVALAVGLWDDMRPLGPRVKFAAFVTLAFAVTMGIGPVEALPLAVGVSLELGFALGAIGSALWIFTLTNTVNFMDGANGLSMGSCTIALIGLAAVSLVSGAPHAAVLSVCAAAALGGFLIWNMPAGRLFVGDAGALFVGTLAATSCLLAVSDGGVSPFIPPILFFPLLADVLLTLAWRVRHGRPMLQGHRDHLYQIGIRNGVKHWKISLVYWALTAHCAALAFVLAFVPDIPSPQVLFAATQGAPAWQRGLIVMAGAVASFATIIAFVVLVFASLRASAGIRRFAAARGLDAP